jgi:hypothetical protein
VRTTTTKGLRRPFERARHAHAPPTARRRRVAGAPAARDLAWSGGDAAGSRVDLGFAALGPALTDSLLLLAARPLFRSKTNDNRGRTR